MAENQSEPVNDNTQVVNTPVGDAAASTRAVLTEAALSTLRDNVFSGSGSVDRLTQTAGLTGERSSRTEPNVLDMNGPGTPKELRTAMLEPQGRKSTYDQFDIPEDAETQGIQKGAKDKFENGKPVYEKMMSRRASDVIDGIKEGKPEKLVEQVQNLFQNLDSFKNPGDASARSENLMKARLAAGALDQVGQKIDGKTRDGLTVDFNTDLKEKNVSITIGQGTNQESTMTINARGQIEMTGPIQNPSDFLKRLKPVSGGRDTV